MLGLALVPNIPGGPLPEKSVSAEVDFAGQVRPILANHCFQCHGMDEGSRKADLRLDLREVATRRTKSGVVPILPGKPDGSDLVRRIFATSEKELMPPPTAKKPLSAQEKEVLKSWIAQGAEYTPHWAFIPPRQVPLPAVSEKSWPLNAIDYFVLARLEKEGLKPSPRADKLTLARRLYLDLIGLPPSPQEADVFVKDSSPDAYERLVARLLKSAHYGERWARRWLDLARYADTNGYEKDRPRSIWAWRDWVINALNADLPFDEFTIEQLAGDMLPKAAQDQIIATGFNRNAMLNEEGGIDPLEYRFYSMVDRVQVTSTTWLGLTMACAQCHTHKYDPIPHAEYYRFMACLDNADEPTLEVTNSELTAQRAEIQQQIDALEQALPNNFPVPPQITWQTLEKPVFSASEGSKAEFLPDGSFRTTGPSPDHDTYTIKFSAGPQTITHLRLEAIRDEKSPGGGPGRSESGNFVLNEFKLEVRTGNADAKPKKLKISSAEANYSQPGYLDAHSIDGKPKTGWAVAGTTNACEILFSLAEPLVLTNSAEFSARLVQTFGGQHTLGHFRLSFGRDMAGPAVTEERRKELRDQKCVEWLAAQLPAAANWSVLHPTVATSTTPTLTIESDDSIFVSGDFRKSDTYTLRFAAPSAGLKAIRLEMLPDDRLPKHGPGSVSYEGPEGDFWLSNAKVRADGEAIALTNASESFASGNNNAAKVIDEDLQSGWSINGGQGRAHNAVFQFTRGVSPTNGLQLEMVCEKHYAAGLGRFRVWVTTNENAKASVLDNEALAVLAKLGSKDALEAFFASREKANERDLLLRQFAKFSPDFAKPRKEIEALRSKLPAFPTTLVMRERPSGHERVTCRHHRGEFLQPREQVAPGVPSFLPPLPANAPANRLALAKWLVAKDNPLTARVIMNRHWEGLFGRGIVRTTDDFGYQGDLPSHPELLDWLAVEFMNQGWSQKKLLKLMVMSATYQQSSVVSPQLQEKDPLNILLARGPRFRLEAELVRDGALAASGLLSEKIGGPSVFPPQPPGVTSEGAYGPLEWKTSEGPDRYRRGLYTFAKRTAPYAMATTFDGPTGEACLARRDRSNTPLQALTLLNDTVFLECARALGEMAVKASGDAAQRVDLIFRRCLVRPPSAEERSKLVSFFETQLARYAAGDLKPGELTGSETTSREQAAWTAVARIVLNLDETITKS